MELWKKLGILTVSLITLGVVTIFIKIICVPQNIEQEITISHPQEPINLILHSPDKEYPYSLQLNLNGVPIGEEKMWVQKLKEEPLIRNANLNRKVEYRGSN